MILAVDTATRDCSVALADSEGTIAELSIFRARTHSKHLTSMVDALLDVAGIRIEEVDAYAVNSGPGTFTGLRIGLAAIKGIAAATGKPLVGVSSLDALAGQAGFPPGHVCCMIDARRGEVYTALYAVTGEKVDRISAERVISPREAACSIKTPCLFIGSGAVAYRDLILKLADETAMIAGHDLNHLRASTIARMGLRQLETRDFTGDESLVPNYIRKSDAKINK